jgi:hypothetical protein
LPTEPEPLHSSAYKLCIEQQEYQIKQLELQVKKLELKVVTVAAAKDKIDADRDKATSNMCIESTLYR